MAVSVSPLAQLRDFMVDRFPRQRRVGRFRRGVLFDLGPYVASQGTLANPGSLSSKVQDNLAEIGQFCESPVVRGPIGANEQLDSLLRDVVGCS